MTSGNDPQLVYIDIPNSFEMTESSSHTLSLLDVPHSDRIVERSGNDERFPITTEFEIGLRVRRSWRSERDVSDG